MQMFEAIKSFLKSVTKENEVFSEREYKYCPDCDGTGTEDFFTSCDLCEGKGFVKKSFAEIHSLDD